MRKHKKPEDIFLDDITKLIKNFFIDNVNYNNGYYNNKSNYDVINDTKERAKYILDRIERIKHLVDSDFDKINN